MTRTARRRWSRELNSEVDGIAFQSDGCMLIHGYDPPAGGMWVDDVIPGKLGAMDRSSGESLWVSPCEVGYGRGFGAGFGLEDDVIVLGPSNQGHRIVRMARDDGRLLGVESIPAFDEAAVFGDLCFCLSAGEVLAVSTSTLAPVWRYAKKGERYHRLGRCGDRLLVVFTDTKLEKQGVLAIDAQTGTNRRKLIGADLDVIHGLATYGDEAVILTADLQATLPQEVAGQFMIDLATRDDGDEVVCDTLSLLAFSARGKRDDAPLWFEILSTRPLDEVPEVGISADSGKLYIVSGALLEARDILTGRVLGEWTVPGLDEQVDWQVCDGAGFLAEEHRISVFELPA